MRRILVLLAAFGLVFAVAACGDDDADIAVTGDTPPSETESGDGGESTDPGDETDDTAGDETGAETEDAEADDAEQEGGDGVPTSDDICAAVEPALESVYGTPTATEPGDGAYPSCDVDFDAARVVVSAFALDDPLVGGDFDSYIDSVGDTVDGLEPVDDVGDQAVANDTGQGYVLVGDNVVTVSRIFNDTQGDTGDIVDVMAAVAEALAA